MKNDPHAPHSVWSLPHEGVRRSPWGGPAEAP